MKKALTTLLAFLSLPAATAIADEAGDRAAVIGVVENFFSGMTAKDISGMQQIMTEDGIIYGYRETADGLVTFSRTHSDYLEGLAGNEAVLVERFWEPEVMLHDRIAVVWTPYDFHSDGEFVHCGINNFSMLKAEDGWKITGVVFSIERDNCAASPLGPFPGAE